jgi:hypothetical protein
MEERRRRSGWSDEQEMGMQRARDEAAQEPLRCAMYAVSPDFILVVYCDRTSATRRVTHQRANLRLHAIPDAASTGSTSTASSRLAKSTRLRRSISVTKALGPLSTRLRFSRIILIASPSSARGSPACPRMYHILAPLEAVRSPVRLAEYSAISTPPSSVLCYRRIVS